LATRRFGALRFENPKLHFGCCCRNQLVVAVATNLGRCSEQVGPKSARRFRNIVLPEFELRNDAAHMKRTARRSAHPGSKQYFVMNRGSLPAPRALACRPLALPWERWWGIARARKSAHSASRRA
jgi:hypothetical protein